MNHPPAGPVGDIDREIDKVSSLIAAARRHLTGDRMVDLLALEGKVRVLCESTSSAPPDDADRIVASVTEMMNDLDRLARELTAQQAKLGGQAEGADSRNVAETYGKTAKKKT